MEQPTNGDPTEGPGASRGAQGLIPDPAYIAVADGIALDLHHQIAYHTVRSGMAGRAGGSSPEPDPGRPPGEVAARLSTRQCEVLYWAGEGLPLPRIAARLGLPPGEVGALVADLRRAGLVEVRPVPPPRQAGASPGAEAPDRGAAAVAGARTLAQLWRLAGAAYAERPFVLSTEDGGALSYADAGTLVDDLCGRLRRLGVGRGDRICAVADPHPEAVLVFWAAMRLGAVFVPIDGGWPPASLGRALALCEPRLVFADAPRAPAVRRTGHACIAFDPLAAADGDPDPARAGVPFSAWLASDDGPAPMAPDEVDEDDSAVILFTSGTTGDPKGVELSQGALLRSSRLMAETYGVRGGDVLLSLGGYHTMSGLRNPLIVTVQAGAATVVASAAERRHPLAAVEVCRRHAVTILSVVPAFLKHLVRSRDRIDARDLATVRLILSTGAELSEETIARFRAFIGLPVCDYYGLTETCGACVLVDPAETGRSVGAIGKPRRVIAQVVDPSGVPVAPGEVGELRIYSANAMKGYYRRPDLTASILRDGWIYTGDLVVRRGDGNLALVGRSRDIIKDAGGDVIHLSEVERLIERDGDVDEVAACGYRDAGGDERYLVFVRLTAGAADPADAVRRLRGRLLEALGPRRMPTGIVPVEDFPRGANGKILKRALVEEYRARDRR